MDANRAKAIKWYKTALVAFLKADIETATKFIKKAHNLFPSQKTEELLKEVLDAATNQQCTSEAPTTTPSQLETNYTPEQLSEVERINGLNDLYEILKVSKTATIDEINKSFRRLARLVHPDKNSAPKSTKAFQALERAKGELINPEKRKVYDEIIYSELKKRNYQESSGSKAEHGNKEQRPSWFTATFWTGLFSIIITAGAGYFMYKKQKAIAGKSKK